MFLTIVFQCNSTMLNIDNQLITLVNSFTGEIQHMTKENFIKNCTNRNAIIKGSVTGRISSSIKMDEYPYIAR